MKSQNHQHKITNRNGVSKTVKMLLLVFAITFSGLVSANTDPDKENPTTLTEEIATLLDTPKFRVADNQVVNVTFILNKSNEIIVLEVDTENYELESYIKSKLNYSKINLDLDTANKTYIIPVRFKVE